MRIDRGKSFRTDKSTILYTMALEGGVADIGVNVTGNCKGDDSMDTKALEFGMGELGRSESMVKFHGLLIQLLEKAIQNLSLMVLLLHVVI